MEEGNKAIEGALKRAEEQPGNNQATPVFLKGWDDVADDGWEDSQSGTEWEDEAEPMDDPKD